MFDQFKENSSVSDVRLWNFLLLSTGAGLQSAVPCAVAWLCACRVLFFVQFPVVSGISATVCGVIL